MSVLTLRDLQYKYEGTTKNVLNGINVSFETGKVYAIIGRSGSGKSTLLSLIAGLDVCTGGDIFHGADSLRQLDRDEYRARRIGVVFQGFNLITNASALENIVLSMHISRSPEADKKSFAYALLERVGIDKESAERKVLQLSGGEQQRVGIARAIAHNPDILIADEPTGNLDERTEADILGILTALAHREGKCVIIVTHSREVAAYADEILGIKEGQIVSVRKP